MDPGDVPDYLPVLTQVEEMVIARAHVLVNGSMCTVYDISWDAGQDPSSMPAVILIKFDDYSGPDFLIDIPEVFPIFPVARQFEVKGVACSRTQFPLRLAHAITVHKSQGLTLSKVVLNLDRREHCLGLSYVAISRVKRLDGLMFERPFDFDRFVSTNSTTARDREVDYTYRSNQLI
jgi:ATP-dependent exoDNAse (exonuclease V) alpha subunit